MIKAINRVIYVASFAYVVAFQYGFIKGYTYAADEQHKMERRQREAFRRASTGRVTPMPDRTR